MLISKWVIVLIGFFSTTNLALAIPTQDFQQLERLKSNVAPPIYEDASQYDFEGIVKLSNCSGSLVQFVGQPLSSKAIVLTNGHCVSRRFIQPGEVIVNQTDRRRMKVADKNMAFHNIISTKIIYATMTDTDAALFELQETYEDLVRKGIRPLELSPDRPGLNTDIEVISGYWERGYSCSIEEFIPKLRESRWEWIDSIRYSKPGCKTIGGTSGSPIIDKNTRKVIGVNNTANESGKNCTLNNPCEVDEDGNVQPVIRGTSYGQQTFWFYSCLGKNFELDLNLPGCQLKS